MIKRWTFLFLLLAASSIYCRGADTFKWMTNLDTARVLAAEQGKPLLVVFRCEP